MCNCNTCLSKRLTEIRGEAYDDDWEDQWDSLIEMLDAA